MRKVIVSNYMTLDGFIAGPNGEIDWFVWDDEVAEHMKNQLGFIDTILFGRVTYELMAGYWPEASPPKEDPVIIEAMNSLPKIVFSRTLEKAEWNNSRLVKENPAEEVSRLKRQPGKDIIIYGSGSIISALTESGLIDEYRLFVNPVILGSGKTMFHGLNERLKLNLINTKRFECGVALLDYKVGE